MGEALVKPLAIDLFCGLRDAELAGRANLTVKQLVACRAEYPEHVPLRVAHQPTSAIAPELWAMGNFHDASLSAGFAFIFDVSQMTVTDRTKWFTASETLFT